MSTWRRKAIELLPEYKQKIERMESVMMLWLEMNDIFEQFFHAGHKSRIRKILQFAAWCAQQHSDALNNAVACAFYEDLCTQKLYWPHFREWFFPHEYQKLRGVFCYHLGDEEIEMLDKVYYRKG